MGLMGLMGLMGHIRRSSHLCPIPVSGLVLFLSTEACLIHQANYLLDRQIRRLERDFLNEGGLRERMTRARIAARNDRRKQSWR